jgi:multimeric flavodoxin WrbA
MGAPVKVFGIVGSYRKGGIVDQTVDEILASAKESGAETEKIYLVDRHIEFCRNCRVCASRPGVERGKCVIEDDMDGILEKIEGADAIVLGSPMNFGSVTAVMKAFIERLVCFAFWPWGRGAPKTRNRRKPRRAVVVASSAAPGVMARFSSRMVKLLKDTAGLLGARTVGVVFIGLAAMEENQEIESRVRRKARYLGKRLDLKKNG